MRSEVRDMERRLADVHRCLDYELSPVVPVYWEYRIEQLYRTRDVLLSKLKWYRR